MNHKIVRNKNIKRLNLFLSLLFKHHHKEIYKNNDALKKIKIFVISKYNINFFGSHVYTYLFVFV